MTDERAATAPARRGWWRRNAVALVAVAVLAPALFVSMTATEQSPPWGNTGPLVPPGRSASLPGASMGPATAAVAAASATVAPRTRAVTVRVDVAPHARGVACGSIMLHETRGARRAWQQTSADVASGHAGDTAEDGCRADQAAPYRMTLFFLVPDDATGPFQLSLQQFTGDTTSPVRFALDPAA